MAFDTVAIEPQTHAWAVRLPFADRRALEALRLVPGITVAVVEDDVWMQGAALDVAGTSALRRLPASGRFELLENGVLRTPGALVPCARLPEAAAWTNIAAWIEVRLPETIVAGPSPGKLNLRLVHSGAMETGSDALLLDLDSWVDWATQAAAVRLQPLRFAVAAADGPSQANTSARVLVLGQPLPPLPGRQLVTKNGILLPAGHAWQPAIDAAVLRQMLRLRTDELVLWLEDDESISIIPAEGLVPASRSAVRLTRERVFKHSERDSS